MVSQENLSKLDTQTDTRTPGFVFWVAHLTRPNDWQMIESHLELYGSHFQFEMVWHTDTQTHVLSWAMRHSMLDDVDVTLLTVVAVVACCCYCGLPGCAARPPDRLVRRHNRQRQLYCWDSSGWPWTAGRARLEMSRETPQGELEHIKTHYWESRWFI